MSDIAIISFSDYRTQATNLAHKLNIPYLEIKTHYFPDGEVCVNLPGDLPRELIFCRSLCNPNNKLIELLLAAKTARQHGVKCLSLVAPYMCYMRQDIAFNPGDAVSQQVIGDFLSQLFDSIITVDPHLHRIDSLDEVFTHSHNTVLHASEVIGAFIQSHIPNAILVGPDEESEQWVNQVALSAGRAYFIASKQRNSDRDVGIHLPTMDCKDKQLVLVDDIISTGRTLAVAAQQLKQRGVEKIYCIATHVLLSEKDHAALINAGVEKVWSTDSISHPTNAISLTGLLAEKLKIQP